MSSTQWKQILAEAGDANLGAALIRLAQQAASLHLVAAAAADPEDPTVVEGVDRRPSTPARRGPVRKEALR